MRRELKTREFWKLAGVCSSKRENLSQSRCKVKMSTHGCLLTPLTECDACTVPSHTHSHAWIKISKIKWKRACYVYGQVWDDDASQQCLGMRCPFMLRGRKKELLLLAFRTLCNGCILVLPLEFFPYSWMYIHIPHYKQQPCYRDIVGYKSIILFTKMSALLPCDWWNPTRHSV